MALPRGRGKAELHRLYSDQLRNFNLHHLIPSSRGGETNEFNLFPYKLKSHRAYHALFLNMTIWEVWERVEEIYEEIFNTNEEKISRQWINVCRLKKDTGLDVQINRIFGVEYLQEKWIIAFGGQDIRQAQRLLKYMMLFIIFGSHMADTNYLFDNGHLAEFFEKSPADENRLRAFNICFGESADWQRIKAKVSKIRRQLP